MKPSERIGKAIEWRQLLAVLDEMDERIALLLQPATIQALRERVEKLEGAGRQEPPEEGMAGRVPENYAAALKEIVRLQGVVRSQNNALQLSASLATEQQARAGWIKCSERMPEIGETVLFYGRAGALLGQTFRVRCGEFSAPSFPAGEGKSPYWTDRLSVDLNGRAQTLPADLVLHWRPLPEGPTT